eukprot:6177548-Pleurochrysis_carterae.AAC.1
MDCLHGLDQDASEAVPDDLLDWLGAPCEPSDIHVVDSEPNGLASKELFVPIEHDICVSRHDWQDMAARSISNNGFCVVRLGPQARFARGALLARCAQKSIARFRTLSGLLRERGIEPRSDRFTFGEICSRTPGGRRYDMRIPLQLETAALNRAHDGVQGSTISDLDEDWSCLQKAIDACARPVVLALAEARAANQAEDSEYSVTEVHPDSAGCVLASAGAPDQHFHPDGTAEGLINVFMPLVNVDTMNGSTELRFGSHQWIDGELGPMPRFAEHTVQTVAPDLQAGDVLLFDYRTMHRGRANNTTEPRPISYL